jgi:hypothetical protein
MTKILDDGLLRVTTDESLPHTRQFAHAKHLKHGYDCAVVAGRSIKDDRPAFSASPPAARHAMRRAGLILSHSNQLREDRSKNFPTIALLADITVNIARRGTATTP